jgi:hypothetical protein
MMKKTILVIGLIIIVKLSFSQAKNKLLGKWQAESSEITSMYHDSYRFLTMAGLFLNRMNTMG